MAVGARPTLNNRASRPESHPFKEGTYVWFPQTSYSGPQRNRRGRQASYSEYLAGIITKVGPHFVEWYWTHDPSCKSRRHIRVLQAQGARVLSESETYLIVQQDPAYTLHDVLNLPQDVAPVPAFSPLQYSLIGFTDTQDIGKWSDLLLHWLPTFDPIALLIRRIDSEAPTGGAKAAWVQCVKALTNLQKQTVTRDSDGNIVSNVMYDQLTMLARCLPILLLRVPKLATNKSKQQTIRRNCNLFLKGSWRSLVCKAKRELEDLNANMQKRVASVSPASATHAKDHIILERARSLQSFQEGCQPSCSWHPSWNL